jgi:F-type H+-transporting ATPase subunit b
MPQLNPGVFSMQLFWLAITFGLLLVLMAKVALPRLSRILDARSSRIDGDIAAAKAARASAEELQAAVQKQLADAKASAAATLKAVQDSVSAEAKQRESELVQKLTAETASAEARIDAAKSAALANVRSVASEVAQAAASKLLNVAVSDADATAAVAATAQGGHA